MQQTIRDISIVSGRRNVGTLQVALFLGEGNAPEIGYFAWQEKNEKMKKDFEQPMKDVCSLEDLLAFLREGK